MGKKLHQPVGTGFKANLHISTTIPAIEAKIVFHSRMTIFQMAEAVVPEKLFRSMLSRFHSRGGHAQDRPF
jgi:hypothetical protein